MAERNPYTKYVGATSTHIRLRSRKAVDIECRRLETNGISDHALHGYGMESQAIQRLQLAGSSPSFLRTAVWRRPGG